MLKILILQYHKVTNKFELGGTRTTGRQFRKHVKAIRELGDRQLELEDLYSPHIIDTPSVLFTFDDGFECVYFNAFPILTEFGYRGAVFPVVGFIGRANDWDASFGLKFRQMDGKQLRELSDAGWWVGSHTMTHPDLRKLSEREIKVELEDSRKLLEDIIGRPVVSIAYPFGLYNKRVLEFVRLYGYKVGFTSRRTVSFHTENPLEVERQGVYIIDMSLMPKIDTSSPLFRVESVKQIAINQFARLSSLARHNSILIRKLAGMKVGK